MSASVATPSSADRGMVSVRFNRRFRNYNAMETAEFLPHVAADIVRVGAGAYEDPNMEFPTRTLDQVTIPREQKDADIRIARIAKMVETCDPKNPEHWDKDGKPSVQLLSMLYGRNITASERDAAFIRCNHARQSNGLPPHEQDKGKPAGPANEKTKR